MDNDITVVNLWRQATRSGLELSPGFYLRPFPDSIHATVNVPSNDGYAAAHDCRSWIQHTKSQIPLRRLACDQLATQTC